MREHATVALTSKTAAETQALGAALARAVERVPAMLVVAIEGELGTGKTTFVGGLLRALGVTGPVRSPTYTLIEPYTLAARSIYHLDLYRIAGVREAEALGIRDLLTHGTVLLIEWPSRGAGVLPEPDLAVSIAYAPPEEMHRHFTLAAGSPAGEELLARMAPVLPE